MKTLVKYDAARAALEACASVDEVKEWADEAAAREAYARQAKDNGMRKMALDIRMRAKRRLGELMALQKATHGMNKGGRPKKTGVSETPVSLSEVGIDKNLARESRIAAAMTPEAFETAVEARRAAIDHPGRDEKPEEFDANAELAESAAEALAIIDADDKLKAAWDEVEKAKRKTRAISALYDTMAAEVAALKREAKRWMKKAKKSATCKACRVALERDDE